MCLDIPFPPVLNGRREVPGPAALLPFPIRTRGDAVTINSEHSRLLSFPGEGCAALTEPPPPRGPRRASSLLAVHNSPLLLGLSTYSRISPAGSRLVRGVEPTLFCLSLYRTSPSGLPFLVWKAAPRIRGTKYSKVKAEVSVPPPHLLAGESPLAMGVGPCSRIPSGGGSAQLRRRERRAECCSAPWR